MSPATRMPVAPRRTTATALLPAMATYRVRPSGDRASALGSLPGGACGASATVSCSRSEEHTSELQSQSNLVCRLLLEKKKKKVKRGERQTAAPDDVVSDHVRF